jgi:hypothetical protein
MGTRIIPALALDAPKMRTFGRAAAPMTPEIENWSDTGIVVEEAATTPR